MTDAEILDLAVEHDIGVRVMPDDYCDLIGVPRGTRYIAENVRPEFVLQFARLLLEKGAHGVEVPPNAVLGRDGVVRVEAAQSIPVEVLRQHWLHAMECDHATGRDKPHCACSRVDLGWHPSVGAAVEAWLTHVAGVRVPVNPSAGEPSQ